MKGEVEGRARLPYTLGSNPPSSPRARDADGPGRGGTVRGEGPAGDLLAGARKGRVARNSQSMVVG